jgi:hypothetical protein
MHSPFHTEQRFPWTRPHVAAAKSNDSVAELGRQLAAAVAENNRTDECAVASALGSKEREAWWRAHDDAAEKVWEIHHEMCDRAASSLEGALAQAVLLVSTINGMEEDDESLVDEARRLALSILDQIERSAGVDRNEFAAEWFGASAATLERAAS